MNKEPTQAYVYQPMPPKEDGRFYGVAGPDFLLRGITKKDAERVAMLCNQNPKNAKATISAVEEMMANDWLPECGCRFESIFSNAVLLCEECSKDPAHNR